MSPPPVIIIPDTTPLIHLAAGNLLQLLPGMGKVIIPDVVAMEATRLQDKPWAPEISAWFKAAAVEIVQTEIGSLYRLALEMGRRLPRNAGEISIVEWLRDGLAGQESPSLVIYEDPLVPRLVMSRTYGAEVSALTTLSFLELAARRGMIASAEAAWQAIITAAPTASSLLRSDTRKPSP